jgi:glutamate N-acetyltransferase/amino-acid N-acetyltransferase
VSDVPAAVAGLFTTNQICAAPVKVCLSRMARGVAQALVANSGNANACTGRTGLVDAMEMTRFTARALQLKSEHILVGSTGRIGITLPMDHVRAGIVEAATLLSDDPAAADHVAEAIMTSDTRRSRSRSNSSWAEKQCGSAACAKARA